ncbi:hypothetical protein [Paraburkholderia sp. EG304]|uniref:hypothetical protein n=1 Tax=Paraburkholderia sp. EG304 TaxID=3237015 RepID=UPI00397CBA70
MKKTAFVLALLALVSPCRAWDTVMAVPNRDGGEIRLTDRPCTPKSSTFGMAYATGEPKLEGCWTVNKDGDIAIHWWPQGEHDFWKTYDLLHFAATQYGHANGWD